MNTEGSKSEPNTTGTNRHLHCKQCLTLIGKFLQNVKFLRVYASDSSKELLNIMQAAIGNGWLYLKFIL